MGQEGPTRDLCPRTLAVDDVAVAPAQVRSGQGASSLSSSCLAQLCLQEGFSFLGWVSPLAALFMGK